MGNGPGLRHSQQALERISRFWSGCSAEFLWSQGANFDEPILNHIYGKLKLRAPWKFHNSRDTRTAYHYGDSLGGFNSYTIKREGTYHNALDDAKHQANCVHLATRAMRRGRADGKNT
jgi:hypothetical protein